MTIQPNYLDLLLDDVRKRYENLKAKSVLTISTKKLCLLLAYGNNTRGNSEKA